MKVNLCYEQNEAHRTPNVPWPHLIHHLKTGIRSYPSEPVLGSRMLTENEHLRHKQRWTHKSIIVEGENGRVGVFRPTAENQICGLLKMMQ